MGPSECKLALFVHVTIFSYLRGKLTPMKEGNNIILYQDDNEITRVSVRFCR